MKQGKIILCLDAQLKPQRMVVCADGPMHTIDCKLSDRSTPSEHVTYLRTVLADLEIQVSQVAILVSSATTFSATIRTDHLPRHNRHQSLIYRLEDHLPLPAEQLAAHFVERGPVALAVAIDVNNIRPWLDALAAASWHVALLAPGALVAVQALALDHAKADIFILGHEQLADLIWLEKGVIAHWAHTRGTYVEIMRAIRAHALFSSSTITTVASLGLASSVTTELEQNLATTIDTHGETEVMSLAVNAAARILNEELAPPINLLSGDLSPSDRWRPIRRPLRFAVSSAALLVLACSLLLCWRGYQYRQAAAANLNAQKAVYQLAFPGQSPPIGIRSRLESEHRRVIAISGKGIEHLQSVSALQTLYETLRRLPTDLRYRLLEIRVNGEHLELEGQTQSHSDAEVLVASLRKQNGFQMDPPHTEKLTDAGVAFTTLGKYAAASEPGLTSTKIKERTP